MTYNELLSGIFSGTVDSVDDTKDVDKSNSDKRQITSDSEDYLVVDSRLDAEKSDSDIEINSDDELEFENARRMQKH